MNLDNSLQDQDNLNFSIIAYNKRENKNSFYQIIGLSFLTVAMMVVSGIVFGNRITATTLLICSIALLLYFLQKPFPLVINYNHRLLRINNQEFAWESIKAWDMVEYDDLTEIYIVTSKFTNTYISFYINKSNFHDYNRFLDYLYQYSEFKKNLAYSDNIQNFLRIVGLK